MHWNALKSMKNVARRRLLTLRPTFSPHPIQNKLFWIQFRPKNGLGTFKNGVRKMIKICIKIHQNWDPKIFKLGSEKIKKWYQKIIEIPTPNPSDCASKMFQIAHPEIPKLRPQNHSNCSLKMVRIAIQNFQDFFEISIVNWPWLRPRQTPKWGGKNRRIGRRKITKLAPEKSLNCAPENVKIDPSKSSKLHTQNPQNRAKKCSKIEPQIIQNLVKKWSKIGSKTVKKKTRPGSKLLRDFFPKQWVGNASGAHCCLPGGAHALVFFLTCSILGLGDETMARASRVVPRKGTFF